MREVFIVVSSGMPCFVHPALPQGIFWLFRNGYVSPGFVAFVLYLSPISVFLTIYARSWRTVTDQAQMMVDNRWTFESVPEVRACIMDNFSLAAFVTIAGTAFAVIT